MGRILRIGADTDTNYSLQSTSAYDEDNPAATTAAWPDSEAMDQLFDQPAPTVVTNQQGALVTFERFPDRFLGVMVKVAATYDTETGENPALEMWTHDMTTSMWTRRRRVLFANVFTGSPTGKRKIYDFTLFPSLLDVDQVWITMDPRDVGAPTLDWYSIQLFGQCEGAQRNDGGGSSDPCDDPTGPFYPGDDICNGVFGNDPPSCDEPDWCNEASIQDYRACLDANIPQFLPIFDTWLDANREGLRDFCAGTQPFPDPPAPTPPTPNPLPPLDLCSEDSIAAFRATVSGDADRLAQFDTYIDSLEESGFFQLTCPEPDPDEQYVDPETGLPAEDPTTGGTPFGSGPGGVPIFPRSSLPGSDEDDDDEPLLRYTQRFMLTWSGNDEATATSMTNTLIGDLPADNSTEVYETGLAHWGPDTGESTLGLQFSPATYGLNILLKKLPYSCRVGVRMWFFRMRQTANLRFSIDNFGVFVNPAVGDCPDGPDWLITEGTGLTIPATQILGNSYYEYAFNGGNFRNNTSITLNLPRVTPTQNDALTCSPGYQARSLLGFQRGGCLVGVTAKERSIWLRDTSIEDFDDDPTGLPFPTYYAGGKSPMCLVLDVQVFTTSSGIEKVVTVEPVTVGLSTNQDAQPIESCV